MNSFKNPVVMVGLAAVVVVIGIVAWRWRGANNENFPEGTWWVCSSRECGNEFNLSMRQLSEHHQAHYGEPVPCPKCGSASKRGQKCLKCGKVTVVGTKPMDNCPGCGAPW